MVEEVGISNIFLQAIITTGLGLEQVLPKFVP
jgi:hypothetical protein